MHSLIPKTFYGALRTANRTILTSSQTIKSEDGPRHDIHQVSRGCTTSGGPDSCTLQVNSNGTVMEKRCHHTCLGMAQNSETYRNYLPVYRIRLWCCWSMSKNTF